MRERYVWDPKLKELVRVRPRRAEALHFIQPDLPAYQSPITGKWIEGRRARRDDLRRSNARPWEGREQEEKQAAKVRAENERKLAAANDRRVEHAWAQLPPRIKRVLEGKAKGYDP
jgi:hypothetical protein